MVYRDKIVTNIERFMYDKNKYTYRKIQGVDEL